MSYLQKDTSLLVRIRHDPVHKLVVWRVRPRLEHLQEIDWLFRSFVHHGENKYVSDLRPERGVDTVQQAGRESEETK